MKNVMILQINDDAAEREYKLFEPYHRVIKRYGKISPNDYKVIYFGKIPNGSTLEDIYAMFNLYHPEDYKGHSLSVSDIIVVDNHMYYVDSYGFRCLD